MYYKRIPRLVVPTALGREKYQTDVDITKEPSLVHCRVKMARCQLAGPRTADDRQLRCSDATAGA